jgi:hypothetical protein
MALTLTQSADLSQNLLYKGIAEELIKESPLLGRYPFMEIKGNALAVNREDEDSLGSVSFVAAGGVVPEGSAEWDQTTFSLYKIVADCDVDNLIQKSRSNINDQMAAQIKVKSKLVAHKFEDQAVYGSTSTSNGFDGLHSLIETGQMVHAGSGTSGGTLTLEDLDELMDTVLGGKPDILLMNRNIRRRLSQKLRAVGSYMTERDDYGNWFLMWNEVPIVVTDWITQTETIAASAFSAKTGGAPSSIFAPRFGEGDGLCGIQSGGINTEVFPKLEQYDATRTRIKWYVGQALFSTKAIARIDGVTDAAIA